MQMLLSEAELRVLGCLVEKELSTPEYYPLSQNSLLNACNQRSNRLPVVNYSESFLSSVLDAMIMKQLIWESSEGRVKKYEHGFGGNERLLPAEAAIMAELMLRGPQTAGELKVRCKRMFEFQSQEQLDEALANLEGSGLLTKLPAPPGKKEPRYCHLLSSLPVDFSAPEVSHELPPRVDIQNLASRLEALEEEMRLLKDKLGPLLG